METPQVEHRLVVRHPRRDAILLEDGPAGARLPAFVSDDRHTALVDYINAAARERLGLATTVLRSVSHSDPERPPVVRVHELEVHGGDTPASRALSWSATNDLPGALDAADREALHAWRASSGAPRDGREWTVPGWLDGVRGWLEVALATQALDVVQLRAWETSCVLCVRVAGRTYYFKALAESLRHECALTVYLARELPGAVARVAATLPERRWLLLEACPGANLEESRDLAHWERSAASYGGLQRACTSRVDALVAAGCRTRTLAELRDAIAPLAADAPALRASVPALLRRCDELEALAIPLTLEHGDLWPANFFVDATGAALIDWEDAAVAHPFLGLAPLRVGLAQAGLDAPSARDALDRAYLAAFAGAKPDAALVDALRRAAPLAFVDMALRYRAQRPSVVRLHPWMRDTVPEALRRALELIE